MRNLRFQTRINIAFALLLFTLLMGGLGIFRLYNLNQSTEEFYKYPFIVGKSASDLKAQVSNINYWLNQYIRIKEDGDDVFFKVLKLNDSLAVHSIDIINNRYLGKTSDLDSLNNAYKSYSAFVHQTIQFKNQGNLLEADTFVKQHSLSSMNHLLSQVDVILSFTHNKANQQYLDDLDERKSDVKFFLVIIGVLGVLNFFLAYLLSQSITRTVKKVVVDLKQWYETGDHNLEENFNTKSDQQILFKTPLELKKAYSKLKSFKEELEQKVLERTLELNKSKEDLTAINKDLIKANKEIERGKDYLINIINTIGHPVFVKDENSCLLVVNNAFCDLFSLKKEQILGKTLEEVDLPHESKEFLEKDAQVIKTGNISITEETLTLKGKEPMYILTTKTRYINENNEKFIIGVITDISKQKKTELNLEFSKENAEKSEALKVAFLANMSHEIRTPMNAILGFTSLLKNKKIDQQQKNKFIKLIENAGNSLLNIISDIVDISKLNANQLKIRYNTFNLNEIIDDLYLQFSLQMPSKNIHLKTIKALKDDECFIKTDKSRLVQVLSNLIENALKFTKQGFVSFGYTIESNTIKFFVEDTGIGINENDQKIIFDRFSQVEHNYLKTLKGTGLGLSIAKGIINLFEGDIFVNSKVNKGTTFYFTIPYVKEAPNKKYISQATLRPPKPMKKAINLLVVEDEKTNFIYIREALRKFNFNIIHAENGKQAVQFFKENKAIDLVLMDMKLPKMNGYQATLAIREISSVVPIIAITAYAMDEDESQALAAGCNQYVSKPFSKQILYNLIFQYLKVE